jgi:hypothetical protein
MQAIYTHRFYTQIRGSNNSKDIVDEKIMKEYSLISQQLVQCEDIAKIFLAVTGDNKVENVVVRNQRSLRNNPG